MVSRIRHAQLGEAARLGDRSAAARRSGPRRARRRALPPGLRALSRRTRHQSRSHGAACAAAAAGPDPCLPRVEGPNELFWIVKHGIKYTGMPAWVALDRDDEVWAVVAFLNGTPRSRRGRIPQAGARFGGSPAAERTQYCRGRARCRRRGGLRALPWRRPTRACERSGPRAARSAKGISGRGASILRRRHTVQRNDATGRAGTAGRLDRKARRPIIPPCRRRHLTGRAARQPRKRGGARYGGRFRRGSSSLHRMSWPHGAGRSIRGLPARMRPTWPTGFGAGKAACHRRRTPKRSWRRLRVA